MPPETVLREPRISASNTRGAVRSRVVMMHGRLLALAVPAALALAAPATAGAACAQSPLDQLVRTTPIVVTAQAQPGPLAPNGIGLLSPATFRVVAYDQGTGPGELKVQTALTNGSGGLAAVSEGVNPMAGQTWRLWGTIGADGVLQTSVCAGSTLMVAQQAPTLTTSRRAPAARASTDHRSIVYGWRHAPPQVSSI